MSDSDKQALINGDASIPYKITILGDTEEENIYLTESDVSETTYEDYRYVDTATICIGQFVARKISGTLVNPNKNIIIENKEIKVEFGVKTGTSTTYYSLGNFLITAPEDNDVKDTVSFEAMDYTKKFNKEFDGTNLTFPCTALQLAQYCCEQCGVELGSTSFENDDFMIPNNQYETGDTYRKVMQDIGKLAYSWIRIGWDNKCYIDFSVPDTTVDNNNIISTDNYYDLSTQNDVFGPVNRVVIGMSDVEGENVYLEDTSSIAANGVCELQIMDNNLTYTPELRQLAINGASRLFGLTYLPFETNTTGHPWLLGKELIRMEKTDGTSITTIPFDRTIEYSGHIKTKLKASADSKTETEYKNPGTLESEMRKTRIIVDKQNQTITQVVEEVNQYDSRISQIETTVDGISQTVTENIDFTRESSGLGEVSTEDNTMPGQLLGLKIYGDVVPVYPSEDLFPSETQYMKPSIYKLTHEYVEEENNTRATPSTKYEIIELPFDYLTQYDGVYDEFNIDMEGKATQIKRIGITENNEKYILPQEQVIDRGFVNIRMYAGINTFTLNYYNPTIYIKYAISNEYTDLFATKLELKSSIEQTSNSILMEVSGDMDALDESLSARIELKVDTENLISEINASADIINLQGNRIIIDSDNFKVSEDGTITANNANLTGTFQKYDASTGYLAIDISFNRVAFYDWEEENYLAGSLGSVRWVEEGVSGVDLYCPKGGRIAIGYDSGNEDNHIYSFMTFDANKPDETPWVRNGSNGTIFPDNPGGGITVQNGFIKSWYLNHTNGDIPVGNNTTLVIRNGLVVDVYATNSALARSINNYNFTNYEVTENTEDSLNTDGDIVI